MRPNAPLSALIFGACMLRLAPSLAAQQPVPADTMAAAVDTVRIDSTAKAIARPEAAPRRVLPAADLPHYPAAFTLGRRNIQELFFEDTAELLLPIPGFRVIRSGDLGQFIQAGYRGAPAQFTRFSFDGIDWPRGMYGQTNLTGIPEIVIDSLVLSPTSAIVEAFSAPPRSNRAWTWVDYIKGPFDIDVLRARYAGTLSQRLKIYWGLDFANSNGQSFTIADTASGTVTGGPFDGVRGYARSEYHFNPELRLTHRWLLSRNDAVAQLPLFPEQQPAIARPTQKNYKDSRLLNSFELTRSVAVSDSARPAATFDLWRLRGYHWKNLEEFRNPSLLQHRRWHTGIAGFWRLPATGRALLVQGRIERQVLSSPTIDVEPQIEIEAGVAGQLRLPRRWIVDGQIGVLARGDFGVTPIGIAALSSTFSPALTIYGRLSHQARFPEPGEYANDIPGFLAPSADLDIPTLQQAEGGVRWQSDDLELTGSLRVSQLNKSLELVAGEAQPQVVNAGKAFRYPSATLAGNWRFLTYFETGWNVDAALAKLPQTAAFWYLPEMTGLVEVRYRNAFFNRELKLLAMLRGRYLGPRHGPASWSAGELPELQRLDAVPLLDFELRLYFREAIFFFRFDNILRERGEWRPQQPVRPYAFRYGLTWILWD